MHLSGQVDSKVISESEAKPDLITRLDIFLSYEQFA